MSCHRVTRRRCGPSLPQTLEASRSRAFFFNRRPGEWNNRGRIPQQAGTSNGPNFAALGATYWTDASNPAAYTASGSTLTSIKNLVSGVALSTVVGAPQIVTDQRNGLPAFKFLGASSPSYVMGADAALIAASSGTDKPYCLIAVIEPDDAAADGAFASICNSGSTVCRSFAQLTKQFAGYQIGSLGYHPAASDSSVAGRTVLVMHSANGLTVKTSLNGGAETTATITSAGVLTADRVGIGATVTSAVALPYGGMISELVYFATDQTPANIAAWVTALISKWPIGPQVMMVGDSISTGQLAANGGMTVLLAAAIRAAGGRIDMQGPTAQTNGPGGEIWYPNRYSAGSGDTCPVMSSRVSSTTTGLGLGGSSFGLYRRTKLVCLMAGTNPFGGVPGTPSTTLTDYTTLLNNIYTLLQQSDPTARIAVTTICEVFSNLAYSQAVNAGLPGIWATFEAAHPGVLIYWNANLANPNDGSATYFVDGTHPNSAGYLRLCNDPTNGLIQAVKPYLMSIQ